MSKWRNFRAKLHAFNEGEPLDPEMMSCRNCFTEVRRDQDRCPACGADPRTGERFPNAEPAGWAAAPPGANVGSAPPRDPDYPADLRVEAARRSSRLWAVASILFVFKLLALLPHIAILFVFGALRPILFLGAQVAVVAKGEYPAGLHTLILGTLRWQTRVVGFALSLTDRYPPFSLTADPDYPVDVAAERPAASSRAYAAANLVVYAALVSLVVAFASRLRAGTIVNVVLYVWALRAIALAPHYFVLYFAALASVAVWLAAQLVILFTGAVPVSMHEWLAGILRWYTRLAAYRLGLVERYPRISLEPGMTTRLGAAEPAESQIGAPEAAAEAQGEAAEAPPTATSSELPVELRGWNWGAFFFGWIWGTFNHTYVGLLVFGIALVTAAISGDSVGALVGAVLFFIFASVALAIVQGAKGNEWAWKHKYWVSAAEFRRAQRGWAAAALCTFCATIAAVPISLAVGSFVDGHYSSGGEPTSPSVAQGPIIGHWAADSFMGARPGLLVLRGIGPASDGSFDRGDLEVFKPGQSTGTVVWTPPDGMVVYEFDCDPSAGRIVATVDEADTASAGYNAHSLVLLDADGTVRRIDGPVSRASTVAAPVLMTDGSVVYTRMKLSADSESPDVLSAELMYASLGGDPQPAAMSGTVLHSLVTPMARPLAGRTAVELEDENDSLDASIIVLANVRDGVLTQRGDSFSGDIGLGTAAVTDHDAILFMRRTAGGKPTQSAATAAAQGPRFAVAEGAAAPTLLPVAARAPATTRIAADTQRTEYVELYWRHGKHGERVILADGPDMPKDNDDAPYVVLGPPGTALIWGWRTGQAISDASVPLLLLDLKTGAIRRTGMVMTAEDLDFRWVQ